MLTSKQRAFLRGMANGMDAIFQVGKNGVTPELRDTVYNALEARELVKTVFWIIICWVQERRQKCWQAEQAQRWYR